MDIRFFDVDGHVLEPAELWSENLEPSLKSRALRLCKDKHGLEYWNFDGLVPSTYSNGRSANVAAIGTTKQWRKDHIFENPDISWKEALDRVPGACNPDDRIKLMNQEGIDISVLYPTLGLVFPKIEDPVMASAYCQVYNDWIVDFCNSYPDRLIPALVLPWQDVSLSVQEMTRHSHINTKAIQAPSGPPRDISYGSTHWDPIWTEHQDQGVPVSLHTGSAGTKSYSTLHPEEQHPAWWTFVVESTDVMAGFVSFFQGAVFDRFPDLKILVLESGCLWMPYILERMDENFDLIGFTTQMQLRPSEYFQRQGWISMEPDDELAETTAKLIGADKLVWAFDYPHSDSCNDPVTRLKDSLNNLSCDDQVRIMGGNACGIYNL